LWRVTLYAFCRKRFAAWTIEYTSNGHNANHKLRTERDMNKLFLSLLLLLVGVLSTSAQRGKAAPEGMEYYLPQTELRFKMLVEKTTYQPGEYAVYAEKYLKMSDVSTQPSVDYRIVNVSLTSEGGRDTSKCYIAPTDTKHNFQTIDIDENGVLLTVNAEPKTIKRAEPFRSAPKPKQLNPRDYMNEDILSAGSTAKMAELCALEIYDIRESKSLLSKGQADFMPKDGEQLRIMLNSLETQERGLTQLFTGVTVRDTTETEIVFVPRKTVERQLLFRFSRWMGMVDADDLGGSPYYISVEDKHLMPKVQDNVLSQKEPNGNVGLYVNMPGKVKVTLFNGEKQWTGYELYAAQFGKTALLEDALFGKKFLTSVVLNPVTGSLEHISTELVKK